MDLKLSKFPGEKKIVLLSKQKDLPPLVLKLLKKVPNGVTVTISPKYKTLEKDGTPINGSYFLEGDRIHITHRDHTALAHELGHAMNEKDAVGRLAQKKFLYPLYGLGPVSGVVAGAAHRSISSPVLKAMALGLPFLLTVPSLVAEAKASMNGYALLKEVGATEQELEDYSKSARKYYLSYASAPLMAGVGMAIGHSVTG